MAPLATPHWEAVPAGLRELLAVLGQIDLVRPFYRAGGTALALRLGHRVSVDLDLFANLDTLDDLLRTGIVNELRKKYEIELLQDSVLGLVLLADGRAASFFSYGYSLLDPTDMVSGVQIAGLRDVGLMKLDAIAGRGTRKDFYDLYSIAAHIPLDELFASSEKKYPLYRRTSASVPKSLSVWYNRDRKEARCQKSFTLHPICATAGTSPISSRTPSEKSKR